MLVWRIGLLILALVCASCSSEGDSKGPPSPTTIDNAVTQSNPDGSWHLLPSDLAVTSKGVPHILYLVYPNSGDDRTRVMHAEASKGDWKSSVVCTERQGVYHDSLNLLRDRNDVLLAAWLETDSGIGGSKVICASKGEGPRWNLKTVNSEECAKRAFPRSCLDGKGGVCVVYLERSKTQGVRLVLATKKSGTQSWVRETLASKEYVPLDLRTDGSGQVHVLARLGEKLVLLQPSEGGVGEEGISLGRFQYARWNRTSVSPDFFVAGELGDLWGFRAPPKGQGKWIKIALSKGGALDLCASSDGLASFLLYRAGKAVWVAGVQQAKLGNVLKLDNCVGTVTHVAIDEHEGNLHCAWIDPGLDGGGNSTLKYTALEQGEIRPASKTKPTGSASGN